MVKWIYLPLVASLTTACNQILEGPIGTFTSPGFPSPYPTNISCTYIIRVGKGKVINLTLENFNVGTDNGTQSCIGDRLEVSGGGIHCGTLNGSESLWSKYSTMTIHFVAIENNAERRYTGFSAIYEEADIDSPFRHDIDRHLVAVLNQEETNGHIQGHRMVVYKMSVATTVVLGIIIGVLVFTVVILSSLLVRQRNAKFRRKEVHNTDNNANSIPTTNGDVNHVTGNDHQSAERQHSSTSSCQRLCERQSNGRCQRKRRSRYKQRPINGHGTNEVGKESRDSDDGDSSQNGGIEDFSGPESDYKREDCKNLDSVKKVDETAQESEVNNTVEAGSNPAFSPM